MEKYYNNDVIVESADRAYADLTGPKPQRGNIATASAWVQDKTGIHINPNDHGEILTNATDQGALLKGVGNLFLGAFNVSTSFIGAAAWVDTVKTVGTGAYQILSATYNLISNDIDGYRTPPNERVNLAGSDAWYTATGDMSEKALKHTDPIRARLKNSTVNDITSERHQQILAEAASMTSSIEFMSTLTKAAIGNTVDNQLGNYGLAPNVANAREDAIARTGALSRLASEQPSFDVKHKITPKDTERSAGPRWI